MDSNFWFRKKVMITGHTGFKGTWLTLWLASLGAEVTGYALDPPSTSSLYEAAGGGELCSSVYGDLLNLSKLKEVFEKARPEVVFHLAAQPLVRPSYQDPIGTFQTNVMGTAYLMEAARHTASVRVIINVTSDKCYLNDGHRLHPFRESDPLGGHDPYSASKACAELVAASYRQSFFYDHAYPRLANVRAGNVIGGGDWAQDRLLPDLMRASMEERPLQLRNPHAIRPWQHVLDPLHGYLLLAEKLWDDVRYAEAWNFGPASLSPMTVEQMVRLVAELWNKAPEIEYSTVETAYEAPLLALDSTKAVQRLGWSPRLTTKQAVEWTVMWYRQYQAGDNMRAYTLQQIDAFNNL